VTICAGSEDSHQIALFQWAALVEKQYPELRWMFHTPNGGLRTKAIAAKFKRMGVKPGVSDICLPVSRNGYTCLWLELKAGSNKPTKNQIDFMDFQTKEGAKCVVCYTWSEARDEVKSYLKPSKG